ncbi:unnamed protein product [Psylliodes chrysocephalus]|uniref:Uncharacterized protein n=1 Tax=Psylliodes chrysocephalus TaxID=3402493 RepID=A0A9P0CJ18_9CUCU|nr:unnamed protein product [Psylliodes chrysocephala]
MCDIMDTRCRLCAECSSSQISILQDNVFCSKIFQLFQIKVCVGDNLPSCVCHECYEMVEKTWSFNDRIQKAQDVLAELVNNSIQEMLPVTSELEVSVATIHTDTGTMVDLDYIQDNKDAKCDFLTEETLEIFSENTNKSIHDNKVKNSSGWRKRKIRYTRNDDRKVSRKKSNFSENPHLENLEFEVKLDGTMIPKDDNQGWNMYPFTCADCHNLFQNPDDIRLHYINAHNAPPRYLCADCPKSYTKYSVFLAHVRVHRSRLRLCCDMCYKWFPTASEQEQHRLLHGETRPYICTTCGKKFRMQSSLIVSYIIKIIKNNISAGVGWLISILNPLLFVIISSQ